MFVLLAALAAHAATPTPPALVVWMEKDLPSDQARAKAFTLAGGGKVDQAAWGRIAYGNPLTEDPAARLGTLGTVLKDGQSHWQEFDAELGVARALDTAVAPVPALRDESDRASMIAALLWEGAAITKPYPTSLFSSLQDTAPFRVTVASKSQVRPWVDALALDPKRLFTRGDFPDARSYKAVLALQQELNLLPRAELSVPTPAPGAVVVVDGVRIDAATTTVELAPGHHYAHVVVGTNVVGAQEFDAVPGGRSSLDVKVSAQDLDAAHTAVLGDSMELGTHVSDALRALAATSTPAPAVYVAAMDANGKPHVMGWSNGAMIHKDKPVTAILTAEAGGGVLNYDGWSSGPDGGTTGLAPMFGGDLGFELGIYYACIQVGADLYVTPTARMAFGNDGGDNSESPAYGYPHAGLGVYLPRPQDGKASFLIAGKYGYFIPGILGGAVSVSSGIPVGNKNWLRITLEGFRGEPTTGFPGTVATAGEIRIGFASLL